MSFGGIAPLKAVVKLIIFSWDGGFMLLLLMLAIKWHFMCVCVVSLSSNMMLKFFMHAAFQINGLFLKSYVYKI